MSDYRCVGVVITGNNKMLKVPGTALVPGKDCGSMAKYCWDKCYARKAMVRPSVAKKWGANSELLRTDPTEYFRQVASFIEEYRPELFRWWIAGDDISEETVCMQFDLCSEYSGTRFLKFTKRFDLVPDNSKDVPDNLTIVLSWWPTMSPRLRDMKLMCRYKVAFAGEAKDYRNMGRISSGRIGLGLSERAESAILCPGGCEHCGMCWDLPKLERDVRFPIH